MSGGIVTVAIGVFERFSGRNISLWIYAVVLVIFAFWACYLAWRDERIKVGNLRERFENEIAELKGRKTEKERRKYLRERLGEFLAEGNNIRWGLRTQNLQSHREFDPWLKRVKLFLVQEAEFDHSHVVRFEAEQTVALNAFIHEFHD